MSSKQEPATTPVRETPIPSMLTNSAREMLEFFEDDIVHIEAEASIDTRNQTPMLRDYGLRRERLARTKLVIDYHEILSDGAPQNPLTGDVAADILQNVHKELGEYEQDGVPDLAVSQLTLRVSSPEIKAATRALSDEFELEFVSDAAEKGMIEPTERLNSQKGLYNDLGFEYRNLNLRAVYETRAKYGEQSDGKLMGWGGPDDVRPRCSRELAQAVLQSVLPDDYGTMKFYRVTDDNVLEFARAEDGGTDE